MSDTTPDVIIVGAGIAGLTCAKQLLTSGTSCVVYDSSDRPGGRIATDLVDGFTLDRGFQVFLTAYPEAKRVLDYEALKLNKFASGALVRWNGKFQRFSDPWRCPQHFWATALSPVGTLMDKLRVARFRNRTTSGSLQDLYERSEVKTSELLAQLGFSPAIVERFFRPFLGGVFLDSDLATSSRMCEFVFRMFAQGDATLPSGGMQAIPQQLADQLPEGCLKLNSPVESIGEGEIVLTSGERVSAKAIVVATDEQSMAKLSGQREARTGRRTACLYFAGKSPPIEEPILLLNGESKGPINNVCIPSQVAPEYAPAGQALVSVTVLKDFDSDSLGEEVRRQLTDWFGQQVDEWKHLRTYNIDYALPNQTPPHLSPVAKSPRLRPGIYQCGDFLNTGSINGAMASGTQAAQAVLEDREA